MFRDWWRTLARRWSSSPRRRRHSAWRGRLALSLEPLEDRTLLSNVQFTLYSLGTVSSYAGVGFQENRVGFFHVSVNGQGDPILSDFHAEINWGDSASWSAGDLVFQGMDSQFPRFDVLGSHVYDQAGGYPLVVYVTGPDGTSISDWTCGAYVAPNPNPPPTLIGGLHVTVYTDQTATEVFATFTDGSATDAQQLRAAIDYGDGTQGPGQIQSLGGDQYSIEGSHDYARPGTYTATVTLSNGSAATSTTQDAIRSLPPPAPVLSGGRTWNEFPDEPATGPVATFTEPDPGLVPRITDTILWGDGTSDTGTITPIGGNTYEIDGSHTYTGRGPFRLSISINDGQGDQMTVHDRVNLLSPPPGSSGWLLEIERALTATARQFFDDYVSELGSELGNLWKFMTNDPVANQKAVAGAIWQYMTTNPDTNNRMWASAAQQGIRVIQTHPRRALAAITFQLLVGKFLKIAEGRLAAEEATLPGISGLNPAKGAAGFRPAALADIQAILDNPSALAAADRQVLKAYLSNPQDLQALAAVETGKQIEQLVQKLLRRDYNGDFARKAGFPNGKFPVVDGESMDFKPTSVAWSRLLSTLKKKFLALFGFGVKEPTYIQMLAGLGMSKEGFILNAQLAVPDQFVGDLQSWIRSQVLDPGYLAIGGWPSAEVYQMLLGKFGSPEAVADYLASMIGGYGSL
jgi:hypothetical protein